MDHLLLCFSIESKICAKDIDDVFFKKERIYVELDIVCIDGDVYGRISYHLEFSLDLDLSHHHNNEIQRYHLLSQLPP